MSQKTGIQWTDRTWNPVRGCSRVSPGCVNCYAEKIAARFSGAEEIADDGEVLKEAGPFHLFAERKPQPHWTGKVELIESKLLEPLSWRNPGRVFVNSMSDLFHEDLSDEDILCIFQQMGKCPRQTFQILTKRANRMRELLAKRRWRNLGHSPAMGGDHYVAVIPGERRQSDSRFLPNVWLGVSVENQQYADERIPLLLQTPAAVRFASYEPALGPVDFNRIGLGASCWVNSLTGDSYSYNPIGGVMKNGRIAWKCLDWVIVGGESGAGARPFNIQRARDVVRQCKESGVACFVKQMGANPRQQRDTRGDWHPWLLTDSRGGDPLEWPEDLRVREFPAYVKTTDSCVTLS